MSRQAWEIGLEALAWTLSLVFLLGALYLMWVTSGG